ncbi:hypothetical protein KAS79_04145 [Candidatus Parcubacteria bacterium]|nr:hypothetical protein [Candidatus Parcubacteria bacterium]
MTLKEIPKINSKQWKCTKNNIFQKEYIFKEYRIKLDRVSRNAPFNVELFKNGKKNLLERIDYGIGVKYFYQLIKYLEEGSWRENIKIYKFSIT